MGVCSSHLADQRHCWSESCALSPSARGGASPSLSCEQGGAQGQGYEDRRSRHPRLPQQGPHSGILTHRSPFLFPRSQGFSNLNATGRPRGSRRLSGAAQRAGGRTHPGRSPVARLGGLERLCTGTRHHPGHTPGDHRGNEVVTAGWPSGQQRLGHPGPSSPGQASAKRPPLGLQIPPQGGGAAGVKGASPRAPSLAELPEEGASAPDPSGDTLGDLEKGPSDLSSRVLERQPTSL